MTAGSDVNTAGLLPGGVSAPGGTYTEAGRLSARPEAGSRRDKFPGYTRRGLVRRVLGPGFDSRRLHQVVAKRVARLVRLVDRTLKEAAVKGREARVESQLSRRVFDRPRYQW